jgi:hypothetical protein
MASTENRIPAWRRLGLALKNEDQSGVAVTDSQTSHGEPEHVEAHDASKGHHDNSQSLVEPAANGKSARLGKRKHQSEPAEDDGQNAKKSKTTTTETEVNGTASHDRPAVAKADNTGPEISTAGASSTEGNQPKGDPNYRKKKAKPARRRREDHDAPQVETTTTLSHDQAASKQAPSALLASTETSQIDHAQFATPRKPLKSTKGLIKDNSGSPPPTDRRKSVAFTPDTKTADGNSGQELFKKWVAEQKGTGAVSAPPEVSNFTLHSLIADEEKVARRNGQLDKPQEKPIPETPGAEDSKQKDSVGSTKPQPVPTSEEDKSATTTAKTANSSTPNGKKKDPSVYIAYLTQYHNDRDHWKFNKAKQNDVVDNALNIFRIPDEHSEALLEYVSGLKGAGVIERLQERCSATLKELDEQDANMDDAEARKVAEEEAEQERIAKERKRRKVEGDVEAFVNHPHSDGYIRRLRRARAKALLTALGRTAPIIPANTQANGINPMMKSVAPPQRDSKKRKRRGEISSDESSSDSSSSESDSDDSEESDSDASSSDDDSDDDSSSDSGSDSDSG